MWVFWSIALLLLCTGFLLGPRLRPLPARRRAAGGAPSPPLSIIIPARDEAHNLPALLESLAAQSLRPHEVIVVDDASSDGTAAIARASGARVVSPGPLPDGWRGKTHACHCGVRAASGGLLLFVDADVRFERPDGLRRLVDAWPGGAFSLCPWHAVETPAEHLSLFFNLNMVLGTAPQGLFGPLLLIDRVSHERCGGHERVRDKVLEHFRLAWHAREAGIAVASAAGRGVVSFRMYPGGFGDLVEGWTKGFASGAGQVPARSMRVITAWLSGLLIVPAGCLVSGYALEWLALHATASAQLAVFARRVGSFRCWWAPLYPVALVCFFAIFARSAARSGRKVTWKGREIHAD